MANDDPHTLHPLLARQLRELAIDVPSLVPPSPETWRRFLAQVNASYESRSLGGRGNNGSGCSNDPNGLPASGVQEKPGDSEDGPPPRGDLYTQMVIDYALDAIVGLDPEGKILDWNLRAESLFGTTKAKVRGLAFEEITLPGSSQPTFRQCLRYALTAGANSVAAERIEIMAKRAQGPEFPIELSVVPLPMGNSYGFSLFIRDISGRKRTERTLRTESGYVRLLQQVAEAANESDSVEQALRTALQLICRHIGWPVGHAYLRAPDQGNTLISTKLWHLDRGRPIDRFRATTEATTFSPGLDLPGKVIQMRRAVWIPDVSDDPHFTRADSAVACGLRSAFAFPILVGSEVAAVLEFFSTTPEGPNPRLLEVLDSVGTQLGRVYEREESRQSLRRLAAFPEHNPNLVVETNEEGRIIYLNPAARRLVQGDTSADLAGSFLEDLPAIVRQLALQPSPSLVREVTVNGATYEQKIIYFPESGGTRIYATDVTEHHRIEAELREAKARAEEAARVKGEFLAMMGHEIRTPMNVVIGMTGVLLDTPLAPSQRHYAKTVRKAAESLLSLLNDILEYANLEAGRLELEMQDFDLREAVEDVLELSAPKDEEKTVELTGVISSDVPPVVRGDPSRFRQVLAHLVGNAVKFTESGEVSVHIRCLKDPGEAGRLLIQVVDSGIGIPAEALDRIFEPFQQADGSTTRKYGGAGLGLTISRRLVERMGGKIGVESEVGRGTTVWVTLPFEKSETPPCPGKTTDEVLAGRRICCAAGHVHHRQVLAQYAVEWRMDYTLATTAAEALALLYDGVSSGLPYDVAILDLMMSGMDAVGLARAIKADPALKDVRLVLLSFPGRQGQAHASREREFDAVLLRPLRKAAVREAIGRALGVLEAGADHEPPGSSKESGGERESAVRILVADDQEVNRQLTMLMLEQLGYGVDGVASGREAVAAVSQIPYALVLMDCHMPDMDGLAATREIRKIEREGLGMSEHIGSTAVASEPSGPGLRHLPLVALVGDGDATDWERWLAEGMDDFLNKPIQKSQLVEVLRKWLPSQKVPESSPSTGLGLPSGPAAAPRAPDQEADCPIHVGVIKEWQELGGHGFIARMVERFLADADDCVKAVVQAVNSGDETSLRHAAHGLKGICRNMGATALAELAAELEQQVENAIVQEHRDLARRLEQELDRSRRLLTAMVQGAQ